MKVFSLIKVKQNSTGGGAQYGDLVSLEPISKLSFQGNKALTFFFPVVFDADIPCAPEELGVACGSCLYHEPELCEFARLKRGLWDSGSIETPPDLVYTKRYYVDMANYQIQIDMANHENKTEEDLQSIRDYALANEIDLTEFMDKF